KTPLSCILRPRDPAPRTAALEGAVSVRRSKHKEALVLLRKQQTCETPKIANTGWRQRSQRPVLGRFCGKAFLCALRQGKAVFLYAEDCLRGGRRGRGRPAEVLPGPLCRRARPGAGDLRLC